MVGENLLIVYKQLAGYCITSHNSGSRARCRLINIPTCQFWCWGNIAMVRQLRHFCSLLLEINIVHYVPLVTEIMSQLYHTSAIEIGWVALAAWKLMLSWKDFDSQKKCMA